MGVGSKGDKSYLTGVFFVVVYLNMQEQSRKKKTPKDINELAAAIVRKTIDSTNDSKETPTKKPQNQPKA